MLFTDSFDYGGTERQVVETLRLLDRSKYDLLVGCLKRRGPFLADVEALGVPIMGFPITSVANWRTLVWMRKLVQTLRDEKIDLVHTFDSSTNLFAIPAARWARVPVVIASRGNIVHNRTAFERVALSTVCRMAHGIVANSEVAAGMTAGGANARSSKVIILPNAVTPGDYRTAPYNPELRGTLNLPVAATLVGVLAALRPEKGHRTFLRAAAQAAAAWNQPRRDLRFVLIGEGPERVALQLLARELGIAERVLFAGDRRNVADWLATMNLVVLPSDAESEPSAVLEAMASARPVVATRVGGVPEIVEEGVTGLLVSAGDPAAMAAAILRLLGDEGLCRRMGAAARARIERDFTPARAKEKLEAFYDRLLAARRKTNS
jgi:glycosyltransferase involved in cell wall biosynthesis